MRKFKDIDIVDVLDKLKKTSLKEFENLDLKAILYYDLFNACLVPPKMFYGLRVIKKLLSYKYEFRGSIEGVYGFVISRACSDRYMNIMNNVMLSLPENDEYLISPKKGLCFEWRAFTLPYYYVIWKRKLSHIDIDTNIKNFLICTMFKVMVEYKKIKKVLPNDSLIYTVLCDVEPTEGYLVQRLVQEGHRTATLQHGHFGGKERPWVYELSKSDYFLAHGDFAKQQAVELGVTLDKIIPLGMANYIGKKSEEIKITDGDFGVLLNGPGGKDDNEMLLLIANEFARTMNKKYYVRCHPALPISLYEDKLDFNYFIADMSGSHTMDEFVGKISFALLGNSTVFIDMLERGKLSFRLFYKSIDIYDGINWCRVQSADELKNKYLEAMNNPEKTINKAVATRNMLCKSGDICKNYADFYKSIRKELN